MADETRGLREAVKVIVLVEYERFKDWELPAPVFDGVPGKFADRVTAAVSEALPGCLADENGDEAAALVGSSVRVVSGWHEYELTPCESDQGAETR